MELDNFNLNLLLTWLTAWILQEESFHIEVVPEPRAIKVKLRENCEIILFIEAPGTTLNVKVKFPFDKIEKRVWQVVGSEEISAKIPGLKNKTVTENGFMVFKVREIAPIREIVKNYLSIYESIKQTANKLIEIIHREEKITSILISEELKK